MPQHYCSKSRISARSIDNKPHSSSDDFLSLDDQYVLKKVISDILQRKVEEEKQTKEIAQAQPSGRVSNVLLKSLVIFSRQSLDFL